MVDGGYNKAFNKLINLINNININKHFELQALLNNPVKGLLGVKPPRTPCGGGAGSYCDQSCVVDRDYNYAFNK